MDKEYRLTWSGMEDSLMLRKCIEHLSTFHLFRDSEAKLINHDEYLQLVKEDKIGKPVSYWQIKEGEVGLISPNHYSSYTTTWERISTAKGDFEAGWCACETAKD